MRKRLLSISISVAVIFVIGALIYSNWTKLSNIKNLVNEVSYKLRFPIVAIIDGNPFNTQKSNILYRSDVDAYFTKQWQYLSTVGGKTADQKYSSYNDSVNTLVHQIIIHNELVLEKAVPSDTDVLNYIQNDLKINKEDALQALQAYGWTWDDFLVRKTVELEEIKLRHSKENFADVSFFQFWYYPDVVASKVLAEKLASESAQELKAGTTFEAVYASMSAEARNSVFAKTKPFTFGVASVSGQLLTDGQKMTPYVSGLWDMVKKNAATKVGYFKYEPSNDLITLYDVNSSNYSTAESFDSWIKRLTKHSLILGLKNSSSSVLATGYYTPTIIVTDLSGNYISGSGNTMDAISSEFATNYPAHDESCSVGGGSSCSIGGIDCTWGYWDPGCVPNVDGGCYGNVYGTGFHPYYFFLRASKSSFTIGSTTYTFSRVDGPGCSLINNHWFCSATNNTGGNIYVRYSAYTPPVGGNKCNTGSAICDTNGTGPACSSSNDCTHCSGTTCVGGLSLNTASCFNSNANCQVSTSCPDFNMSVSVNGSNVTFNRSGGETCISDTGTGSCGTIGGYSGSCTATFGAGNYVWTHSWKPNDATCSNPKCSKSVSFTVGTTSTCTVANLQPVYNKTSNSASLSWTQAFDQANGWYSLYIKSAYAYPYTGTCPTNQAAANWNDPKIYFDPVGGSYSLANLSQNVTGLLPNTKYCVGLHTNGNSCGLGTSYTEFATLAAPPTCSVSANPTSLTVGGSSSTLTLSSTNTTTANWATSGTCGTLGSTNSLNTTTLTPASSSGSCTVSVTVSNSIGNTATCSTPTAVTTTVPTPVCTSAAPQSATTTATSGTFYVYAYGVTNTNRVRFPTWSDVNGQDDIVWYEGVNQGGGTWRADINLANHPGLGLIYVHIYMVDAVGTNVFCNTANFTRLSPAGCTGAMPSTADWVTPANAPVVARTVPVSYSNSASVTWTPSITPAIATASTCASNFTGNAPVAYWKIDEGSGTTTADSAAGLFPGTLTGATWQSGASCVAGSCLSFSAAGYVDTGKQVLAQTDNWTLAAWVKPADISTTEQMVLYNGTDPGGYGFVVSGNQLLGLYGAIAWIDSGYRFAAANQWYHIVMERAAGTTKFFVNGTQTPNTSTATPNSPTNYFQIGHQATYAGRYFNGSVDNVRVYNYARSAAQILEDAGANCNLTVSAVSGVANYGPATLSMTTNPASSPVCTNKSICVVQKPATPTSLTATSITSSSETLGWASFGTGAAPSALWKLDETTGSTAADSSGNNKTLTWGGTLGSQWVAGKFANSGYFNGTNNYLRISGDTTFNRAAGQELTVETWIKPTRLAGQYQDIVVSRSASAYNWMLYQHATGGSIQLHGVAQNVSTYIPPLNVWTHIAATVTSAGIYTLYANGTIVQGPLAYSYNLTSPNELSIGSFAGGEFYQGGLDDIRIYNYARTLAQILDDMNLVVPAPRGCTWDANTCSSCQYNFYAEWGPSSGNYTAGNSGWLNNPPAAWNNEVTSYNATGLTCDQTYYWRVRRGTGYSGVESLSAESTFTTAACPVPTGQIYFQGEALSKRLKVVNPPLSGSSTVNLTGNVETGSVTNAKIDSSPVGGATSSTGWNNVVANWTCSGSTCAVNGGFSVPYNLTTGNYQIRVSGGGATQTCVGAPRCSAFDPLSGAGTSVYSGEGAYSCLTPTSYFDCGATYSGITNQDNLTLVVCPACAPVLPPKATSASATSLGASTFRASSQVLGVSTNSPTATKTGQGQVLGASTDCTAVGSNCDLLKTTNYASINLMANIPWPSDYLPCLSGRVKLEVSIDSTFAPTSTIYSSSYRYNLPTNTNLISEAPGYSGSGLASDVSSNYIFPITDAVGNPPPLAPDTRYYWRVTRYMYTTNDADVAGVVSELPIRSFVIPALYKVTATINGWTDSACGTGSLGAMAVDTFNVSTLSSPVPYNSVDNNYIFYLPTGSYDYSIYKQGYSICGTNTLSVGSADLTLPINMGVALPGWIQAVDGDLYIHGVSGSTAVDLTMPSHVPVYSALNKNISTATGVFSSSSTASSGPTTGSGNLSSDSTNKHVESVNIACDQITKIINACPTGCTFGSYTVTSNPSFSTVGSVKTASSNTIVLLSSFPDLQQYTYVIPSGSFLVCGDINVTNYSNTTKATTPGITAKLDPGIFVVPSTTLSSSGVGTSHVTWKEISQ